jgi:hypothetical protein
MISTMARLRITDYTVTVVLSVVEKVEALHRNITVPRWAILGVRAVADGMAEARGRPGLGTEVPGVVMAGTFSRDGARTFAICHGHRPAVVIELSGQPFDRLLVTVDDPDAAAARLTSGLSPAWPED